MVRRFYSLILVFSLVFSTLTSPLISYAAEDFGDEISMNAEDAQVESDVVEDEMTLTDDGNEYVGDEIEFGDEIEDDVPSDVESIDEEDLEIEIPDIECKTIKAFVPLEESELILEEKPLLEEVNKILPSSISAVMEDDSIVEIEVVKWECTSDYEVEAESYAFVPIIAGYDWADNLELPYVVLYFNNNTEISTVVETEDVLLSGQYSSNDKVNAILTYAYSKRHSSEYNGLCQAFVKSCYEHAGIYADGDAPTANEAKNRWRVSNDLNNIPIGACVYFVDSAGGGLGHVAIYVGDGKIIHSVKGLFGDHKISYIEEDNLSYHINKGNVECWGYQAGKDLYDNEEDATADKTVITINIKRPDGNLNQAESFSVNGSVYANARIKSLIVGVADKNKLNPASVADIAFSASYDKAVPFFYSPSDIAGKKYYNIARGGTLDEAMKFMSLQPGAYIFFAKVVCENGASDYVLSEFNVIAKTTQHNYTVPTLTLTTNFNQTGDSYAVRAAYLKNPSKRHITQGGMELYDSNGHSIGRRSENLNSYDTTLTLYYATDNKTDVNLGKQLTPGTYYEYRIWAVVDGQEYSVRGSFNTTGSRKPATPILSVDKYELAIGDTLSISWNAVENAIYGYLVHIREVTGNVRTIYSAGTSAVVTMPEAGEYDVSIIASGYENSDEGHIDRTIKVYPDCNVKFIEQSEDGTEILLKEETVKYNTSATAPPAPSRTGWIFQGWDKGYQNVKTDITVCARFTKCIYSVEFIDIDGQTLDVQKVEYLGAAELPANPEPKSGYVFTGWDSDAYTCVKGNTTITATYVYENAELPVQLEAVSCGYDADGTGYTVTYNVTNYDQAITRGRAIVALMTSEDRLVFTTESNAFTLKKSQSKNNVEIFLPYEGDAAYANIVIVDSFSNSIPLSEKKSVVVTRSWSGWSTDVPDPSASDIESRTEYRYRDKSTTESTTENLSGWTYDKTIEYWTEYGGWSAWSASQYYASDSRKVETRTVTDRAAYDEKQYYFYKYFKDNVWWYSYTNRDGQPGVYLVEYQEFWLNLSGDNRTLNFIKYDDGYELYTCTPNQFYEVEYFYPGVTRTVPAITHTEWRCADRSKAYKYQYHKWSSWSEWSPDAVTASSTREVETRTVYRYKSTAPAQDNWTGEMYTVSGKVSTALAGKQALLVVYKHEEPSDFNNEFLGQTLIGDDGSYEFTFLTREEPSALTGDFTVKLGIEGSNELLYIKTIEAPKPVYTVNFFDWDGTLLDTAEVVEGGCAGTDVAPSRMGYSFIGWNTGLTNVHDNIDVVAMYNINRCTVFFVDTLTGIYTPVEYDCGSEIIYPALSVPEGYVLNGWVNEENETVDTATGNMVLRANYELKEYTVTFFDQDNSELKSTVVQYGESVIAPEPTVPEGQRFAGWSTYDYTNVKRDMDIYPSFAYFETTKAPHASIKSQTLDKPTTVELVAEEGVVLYTTDGTTPNIFSTQYTEPITITENTVLQFYARSNNKNDSEVVSEAYILQDAEDIQGSLMLKPTRYNLTVGQSDVPITYVKVHENPDIGVSFKSLDESVAVVDEDGKLIGIGVGSTRVFAMTDDCRYADYCEVSVTSDEIAVTSLELETNSLDMLVGEQVTLMTTLEPENATYQDILWSTNNNDVVTVDEDGQINAVGTGHACITALSHTGSNIAYCYVNVEQSTLSLSSYDVVMAIGQKFQLNALLYNQIQDVKWSTDNASAVVVDSTGLLEAKAAGEAVILAMADNGDFRTCKVRVTKGIAAADPPAAPVIESVTDTTITVKAMPGCDYSLDGDLWQESPRFVGLTPETAYIVYARTKETAEALASSPSLGTNVTTAAAKLYVSDIAPQIYTGNKITPEVVVRYKGTLLTEGTDYKVKYSNNINVSDIAPTVLITGLGHYMGSEEKHFAIKAKSIQDSDIVYSDMTVVFNGKKQLVKPVIKQGKKTLTLNKDYTLEYVDQAIDGAYQNAGTYDVLVKGINNYTGEHHLELVVTNNTLISKASVASVRAINYTGEQIHPRPVVTYKGQVLVEGDDYTYMYPDAQEGAYVKAGSYRIQIVGKNSFAGTRTIQFSITGLPISGADVTGLETTFVYTGEPQTQSGFRVYVNGKVLVEDSDYTVSYIKNTDAGKATMTITGIGGYKGTLKKVFTIRKLDIAANDILFVEDPDDVPFAKGGAKPNYVIEHNGVTLVEGQDYTVKLTNNKALYDGSNAYPSPTAVISGKGNYEGSITRRFFISEQNMAATTATINDVLYTGKANYYKVKPVLYDLDGKKLVAGKDYDKTFRYKYADGSEIAANEIPGAGSDLVVVVKGINAYYGEKEIAYHIGDKKLSQAKVTAVTKVYTSSEITLNYGELKVMFNGAELREGVDFEVLEDSYQKNIKPGTATVVIRGLNDYVGTVKVKIKITKRQL